MSRRLAAVPDAPRRAIALIRVSKARGRDDLISPQLQRTAIADYASRSGIDVVEWVEALDESASRSRSPWWRRLEVAGGTLESATEGLDTTTSTGRLARGMLAELTA